MSQSSFWKHLQVNEFSLVVFHDDGWFAVKCEVTVRRRSVFGGGVAFEIDSEIRC